MTLAIAWLVCFRRALLVGAFIGLALSLASVLSGLPSNDRVHMGAASAEDLDGSPVRAGSTQHAADPAAADEAAPRGVVAAHRPGEPEVAGSNPAGATLVPRAIRVGRGSPLTLETSRDPRELAVLAAMEFGVEPARMLALGECESRFDPDAIGDGGLALSTYQWHARTWRQYAAALGYSVGDIFDQVAQARLTAWMVANGHGGLWSCWP